ncbi:arylsulfatase [Roseateles sp.]|uniref:arylsulfatase n=1 Tax=Roseateles sp. TaxID=1971397 RepID=UPI003BAAD17E
MKTTLIELGLASALLAGGGALAANAPPAPTPRPNIVVLVADDWGYTDVGAFGGEIATPNLDELARRGVRFSNFHVAASCSPTRAMLLTGVDNHRNGHGNLRETMPGAHLGQPGYQATLTPNVVTVATLLQAGGYRTSVAGKWNVGNEARNLPNQRGFDRSFIMGDTGSDNWEPEKRYLPHAAKVHWFEDGQAPAMPKQFYSSTFFVDKTIEYLREGAASGKPFFAYVGFQANHVPVQAPQAFIDKYKGRYDSGWTALREARRAKAIELGLVPKTTAMVTMGTTLDWTALSPQDKQYQARLMEVYAAMADAMDHEVGRLIAHLKSTGEYDNTVFVFLSDNGPEGSDYKEADLWLRFNYSRDLDRLGGPGAYVVPGPSWSSASASPLSTFKFYAGEGGIRSPMIISGMGVAAANQIHAGLAHVTDIVPTLLDLAQVQRPGTTYQGQPIEAQTGRSLLPVLADPSARVRRSDEALGYELAGNKALFKGDLKLVLNNPPVGDGQWHLYDLRADPGETKDLQTALPAQFAAMQADYDAWARANGVLPMPAGYNPVRQVLINSFVNYWIPTYWPHGVVALLVLLGVPAVLLVRARRRRGAPR